MNSTNWKRVPPFDRSALGVSYLAVCHDYGTTHPCGHSQTEDNFEASLISTAVTLSAIARMSINVCIP